MNTYGLSTSELFHVDDLLDLSNEELFSSASTSTNNDPFPPSVTPFSYASASSSSFSNDFTHDLCLPNDDVAELEWFSQFVDDSFTDFPSNSLVGTLNPRNDHSSFSSKAWSKLSRAPPMYEAAGKSKTKKEIQRQASPAVEGGERRCTHCASEKTPQWRTGPLGPKTLCNACGVRYKSGRLVPEYRPAASPTFMLTQHSNSHRKVLELRRQKELSRQQQEQEYRHHHHQQHRQQHDFEILTAYAFHPFKVPAFSFALLELFSHKSFMPKLLTGNAQKGWPYIQRLLVDLLQFLEPFLRNAELRVPVHFLSKSTLRVLLVLLHDFPEFLCDCHFTFCDVIPQSCIQMRNIIPSAFPRNMRLPDPSTPNLNIDLLPEIREPPHFLSEVDAALKAKQMKADVDEYLKMRPQGGSTFLTELKQRLLLSPSKAASAGTLYNVPLINSLVVYVGMQPSIDKEKNIYTCGKLLLGHSATAVESTSCTVKASTAPVNVFLVSAALDIYQTLIGDLDTEGRYLFLNAIANQLRYPNNNTHYFSFILLYLFAKANQEIIQVQITRVLLEPLIVNKPHPWGLLVTFIELIKNPRYYFWNRSFIRCAPEIEKLFESVQDHVGA